MLANLRRLLLLALAGFVLVAARPAFASANLRKELTGVAKNIKQLLDSQQESAIAIGQFTGPANYPTSSGPGIAQVLSEELQKLGVHVKQRAKLGIKGEYYPVEVPPEDGGPGKDLAVQLKGAVEDGFGKVVADFSFKLTIRGENAFVEMIGVPVQFKEAHPAERVKKLQQAYTNPQTHTAGTRISAGAGSPYAIEVLVERNPRSVENRDGLAFVKLQRGESYTVRLINDSPHDAAVRLSIDGLSMFAFSELRQPVKTAGNGPLYQGEPLYNILLVPKYSAREVKGWHRTNDKSDAFLVTDYARSAAATINHKTNLGTITATFAAAWPASALPPSDEPPKSRDPNATGFGARVNAAYVAAQRTVGAIRASVSVRYGKD